MEANTGCFTTCIPIGILCISLCDAASFPDSEDGGCPVPLQLHEGTSQFPARYPCRDHWGLSENWIFYPFPWRDLQTPQPYFPWRQNWMLLGEELAHGKWWAPGISPGLTLAHRGAGIWGWDAALHFHPRKAVLGFAPGKMSPVIQGVMIYYTFWWSGTTGHFWPPTTKSLWLHFHI